MGSTVTPKSRKKGGKPSSAQRAVIEKRTISVTQDGCEKNLNRLIEDEVEADNTLTICRNAVKASNTPKLVKLVLVREYGVAENKRYVSEWRVKFQNKNITFTHKQQSLVRAAVHNISGVRGKALAEGLARLEDAIAEM